MTRLEHGAHPKRKMSKYLTQHPCQRFRKMLTGLTLRNIL